MDSRKEDWMQLMISRTSKSSAMEKIMVSHVIKKIGFHSFKIEKLYGEAVRNLYLDLKRKNNSIPPKERKLESWSENERRLFIWFIVCYYYFIDHEGETINSSLFKQLSPMFFYKDPRLLEFQYLNILKSNQRVSWYSEEDKLLKEIIRVSGASKWNQISRTMFFESEGSCFKSAKHCRERWLNHLNSRIVKGDWKTEEDLKIVRYVQKYGKRWSKIIIELGHRRTEHMVKNRFNSLIRKAQTNRKQKQSEILLKLLSRLQQVYRENTILPKPSKQQTPLQQLQYREGQKNSIVQEEGAKNMVSTIAEEPRMIYSPMVYTPQYGLESMPFYNSAFNFSYLMNFNQCICPIMMLPGQLNQPMGSSFVQY